jgi:uncharacterized phage-like protein YoqJ
MDYFYSNRQLTFDDTKSEPILMDDITPTFARETAMCFSGHRPEGLPGGTGFENIIKSYITLEVKDAITLGYKTFIMGGSRGIDLWAGLAVIGEKRMNPNIHLIAALPFYEKNTGRFSEFERFDYGYVLDNCDGVFYATESYNRECMKRRNLFMIENSSRIVAFVNDYRSGTGQTIRFAQKAGITTRIYTITDCTIETPDKTEE